MPGGVTEKMKRLLARDELSEGDLPDVPDEDPEDRHPHYEHMIHTPDEGRETDGQKTVTKC